MRVTVTFTPDNVKRVEALKQDNGIPHFSTAVNKALADFFGGAVSNETLMKFGEFLFSEERNAQYHIPHKKGEDRSKLIYRTVSVADVALFREKVKKETEAATTKSEE